MSNGNVLGGERPRNADDAYYTPDALALAIAQRVRESFGGFDLIVEPSAGGGAFVRAARAVWERHPWIVAVEPGTVEPGALDDADLVRRARWEDVDPFASLTRPAFDRLVIGNPPYNLPGDGKGDKPTTAERHVLLALDRMRDGDVLVFLLRLAFLSGGGRIERLHARHGLAALWPVTPRPSFTLDGKSDASEYGVFVWRKGYAGPCDLRPLRWVAP